MRQKNSCKINERTVTVDTKGLCEMLNAGRSTAIKIGTAAGARIKVGKAVLWNIRKTIDYVEAVSGQDCQSGK